MMCSVFSCNKQALFLCNLCSPEQLLCSIHNKQHSEYFRHSTIQIDTENDVEMNNQQFKTQTNEIIAYIYKVSRQIIKQIETNSTRTIQNLIQMNKSVTNYLDLNFIIVKENEISEIYQRLNNLFQITNNKDLQKISAEIEENKRIEMEKSNSEKIKYELAVQEYNKNPEVARYLSYSNSTSFENLISPKMHPLVYLNNREDEIYSCSHCEIRKREVWSCSCCDFYLCEDCSIDQMHSNIANMFQNIKCANAHQLFYYSENERFYIRKSGSYSFIQCNSCSKTTKGGSWSCRICSFNLCQQCINLKVEFVKTVCNKNHYLKKIYHQGTKINCDICKLLEECFYCCVICNFNSCNNCVMYYENAVYLPVQCTLGHKVVDSKDQIELYKSSNVLAFLHLENEKYGCDACGTEIIASRNYHCRRCRFDLCDLCYNTIILGRTNGLKIKCDFNHELKWFFNTKKVNEKLFICNLCQKSYDKCGSFYCDVCRFNACIKCCRSLING